MRSKPGSIGSQTVKEIIIEGATRRDVMKALGLTAGVAGLLPMTTRAAGVSVIDPALWSRRFAQSGTGGTLVVALATDSETLDPYKAFGPLYDVFRNFYDPLTELNLNNEIEGILAESWEISDDQLEYTFHLRQGIMFHDGTPVNADAIKFTFDRVLDPATAASYASWVGPLKETVVVDEYTVKLVLAEPFSPLLGNISIGWYGIPSPTAVQKYGEDFGRNPVGSGPFMFKEWVSAEHLTLVPNPNYHNYRSDVTNLGAPLLETLEFRIIPDVQTQTLAFEAGEVDAYSPSARDVEQYQNDSDYEVFVAASGTNVLYIEFVSYEVPEGEYGAKFKPPFDDILVRQAVGAALNIDEMLDKVLLGRADRNYGPMPSGLWAYKPEIEQFGFHYDQDKARALLDQAGWVDSDGDGVREKDGNKLEVLFWSWVDADNEKCAQIIQNQLGQVGFKVNIEMLENEIARQSERVHNFNFNSFSLPEPDVLRLITEYPWGLGLYKDEQFKTLVNQALLTTDRDERTALYFEASKKMLADAAMIPFWTPLPVTAVRASVKNYKMGKIYSQGLYSDVSVED
jgi:peptide/nickel transport system substrate-binding protein